jgi:hypothetical protein
VQLFLSLGFLPPSYFNSVGVCNNIELLSVPIWNTSVREESSHIVRFCNLLSPTGLRDAVHLRFHSQTKRVASRESGVARLPALWNRLGQCVV